MKRFEISNLWTFATLCGRKAERPPISGFVLKHFGEARNN